MKRTISILAALLCIIGFRFLLEYALGLLFRRLGKGAKL